MDSCLIACRLYFGVSESVFDIHFVLFDISVGVHCHRICFIFSLHCIFYCHRFSMFTRIRFFEIVVLHNKFSID